MESVNLLRPRGRYFKGVARLISVVLALWFLLVFGFQFLLVLIQRDPLGSSWLTDARFLGFPFHYWFTGQFAILAFLLLCLLFNRRYDQLISREEGIDSEAEGNDNGSH